MSITKQINNQWNDASLNLCDMLARFEFLEQTNNVDSEINTHINILINKILNVRNYMNDINDIMDKTNSDIGTTIMDEDFCAIKKIIVKKNVKKNVKKDTIIKKSIIKKENNKKKIILQN